MTISHQSNGNKAKNVPRIVPTILLEKPEPKLWRKESVKRASYMQLQLTMTHPRMSYQCYTLAQACAKSALNSALTLMKYAKDKMLQPDQVR